MVPRTDPEARSEASSPPLPQSSREPPGTWPPTNAPTGDPGRTQEHDERFALVLTARTFDDLAPLTTDLVRLLLTC